MTGRERTLKAIHGEPTDRLSVHPLLMTFAARFIGVNYRSYVSDYRVLADAQIRAAQEFNLDSVTLCSDPCREAADCGAAITWFEDQPPTPDPNHHLITEKADLLKLRTPDPLGGGRMHDRVKGTALLRERAGDDFAVVGWVEGPIAEAADLRGINTIMLDLIDDPQFITDLFDFITPMEIDFAKAQIEAGADIIGIGDAAASLVGPTFYREYVLPYEKQLVDAIHESGALVRLHICGNIDHLLDDIAHLGVDTIDIDFLTNLSLAKEKLGSMPMLGNMEPVGCLQNGTPDAIKATLTDCHNIIGDHFIIGAGCEVPPATPHENLRAMVEYSVE